MDDRRPDSGYESSSRGEDVAVAPDASGVPLAELLRLDGRVAVVTGAARGIGAAIAGRLVEAGAAVVVGDIEEAAAVATADHVRGRDGQAIGAGCDAADAGDIERLAETAVDTYGHLDVWINNAGIFPFEPSLDMGLEQWQRVIDLNLTGVFLGSRSAAARMDPARRGVIVNIASTAAFRGYSSLAHYSASKHGVLGVTKALAVEFAPRGIRVLAVAPTLTDTPGVADLRASLTECGTGDIAPSRTAAIPLGRIAAADDVARVVVFCASDLAAFMTGSVLLVDGGILAG